jgi:hypothetical protein
MLFLPLSSWDVSTTTPCAYQLCFGLSVCHKQTVVLCMSLLLLLLLLPAGGGLHPVQP